MQYFQTIGMEYYTWVKVVHIMAFMSWMAVLFYMPRLFVYHVEHIDKKDFVDVVRIQEYKIYYYIGIPALVATYISGIAMIAINPYLFQSGGWLHAKLLFAVILTIYSYSMGYYYKKLLDDNYEHPSGNYFRAYNEVPTYLSLLIVAYAVTKVFSLSFTIIVSVFFVYVIYKVFKQKPHKS